MTHISFYDSNTGKYIKQWPNWSGVVPALGDVVVLHYGDNNEEERPYLVKYRVIDGTKPDNVKIYIEEINRSSSLTEEEIEDLKREMERLSAEHNPKLDIRIEDCNLSVRITNICKANGIDTLGDLYKLHKTDWLKFRNGGKKSLIELDDLLHDNGLDWAPKYCLTIQASEEDVNSPDFDLTNHIIKKFKKAWLKKAQEFELTQHHFPFNNVNDSE